MIQKDYEETCDPLPGRSGGLFYLEKLMAGTFPPLYNCQTRNLIFLSLFELVLFYFLPLFPNPNRSCGFSCCRKLYLLWVSYLRCRVFCIIGCGRIWKFLCKTCAGAGAMPVAAINYNRYVMIISSYDHQLSS